MASRTYDLQSQPLGSIATFTKETAAAWDPKSSATLNSDQKDGSLASTLKPKGSGQINVVKDYRWTLSNVRDMEEIPYIRLVEYKCNESSIRKQINAYSNIIPEYAKNMLHMGGQEKELLDVYTDLWPKTNPTDFSYWLPYFNQTGFELKSQPWQALDSIGDSVKGGVGAISKTAAAAVELVEATANLAMNAQYPSVGVVDRPRIFMGHDNRQITITFPLYNTVAEEDWMKNRDLIYVLMSQNLFNKRDYTTGVPPVFYDIYIPGQYYCYAASMVDIKVENLGNQRLLYNDFIVPDAYQVSLTLSEMVMPSKNQFEAITNGAARNFVNSEMLASTKQNTGPSTASQAAALFNTNKQYDASAFMGMGGLPGGFR